MAEEFGPWIEHDGKSRPQAGIVVWARDGRGIEGRFVVTCDASKPCGFLWGTLSPAAWQLRIVAYRIRRPDALRRLIDLAADPEGGLPQRFPLEELA